tara:strand:- start:38 stop:436 length:399 start_codon:yes stop_codon:yes gene_type:complete
MKFYSSAKLAIAFISLCCISVPAIAACSDNELKKYARLDDVLIEYKELFKEAMRLISEDGDAVKYCQLEKRLNKLSLEYISVDKKLKEACPVFYSNEWLQDGKKARDLFNHNQPKHQAQIDACAAQGINPLP